MHTNTNTMNSTNSKGSSITAPKEKLMEDLRLVMSDAEDLLRATASQAGEGAAAARVRIQESLQSAKKRLMATETAMIEQTQQAAKDADQYVRDNPWKAVGISAIAGAVIGLLIARR